MVSLTHYSEMRAQGDRLLNYLRLTMETVNGESPPGFPREMPVAAQRETGHRPSEC